MNQEPAAPTSPAVQANAGRDAAIAETTPPAAAQAHPARLLGIVALVAVAGVVIGVLLWQKLSGIQEQLARQSADTGLQAGEARAMAKQAQELSLDTAAKLAVTQARLAEVTLQRTQLEDLMQSLARSRDENLVVDIESALRLAQQQSQLTGSLEPLLAALKSAEGRVNRAAQPRLAQLQGAIARDLARVKATALADTPALLVKLDELVILADEIPVGNALPSAKVPESVKRKPDETVGSWWVRLAAQVREELYGLVRISRIEDPEAALLAPDQVYFLRENLKLKLLNARLGLLSRQIDSARSDMASASALVAKYFDNGARKTQVTQSSIAQVQHQLKSLDIPRIDDTLAALATAAAGR